MRRQERRPLAAVLAAMSEYNGLLSQMEELTDRLSDAIKDPDLANLETLLQTRTTLGNKVSASSRALQRSLAELGTGRDSAARSEEAGRDRLRLDLDRTERLRNTILEKQAACETALARRLQECKTALTALGQRRGLRVAYQGPTEADQARFLDSKL